MATTTGSATHDASKNEEKTREDRAAEATPYDATSMSVGPPSGDAREASEEVGEPQANPDEQGPSPPNKRSKHGSAPPVDDPAESSKKDSKPDHNLPDTKDKSLPSRETLKALGADEEE